MGYQSGETSRFDQAKAVAAQLGQGRRGRAMSISVILMGSPPRVVIGEPSHNLVESGKRSTSWR